MGGADGDGPLVGGPGGGRDAAEEEKSKERANQPLRSEHEQSPEGASKR